MWHEILKALKKYFDGKFDTKLSSIESVATSINSKLSQPTTLKSENVVIDNSGGSEPITQQLFTTSTPSRYATIYRDPSDTGLVYIGDSEKQVFPLEPGGKIETTVSDLSNIFVKVPAGVKCTLHILWEV